MGRSKYVTISAVKNEAYVYPFTVCL